MDLNPKLGLHWLEGEVNVGGRTLDISFDGKVSGKHLTLTEGSLFPREGTVGRGQPGVRDMLQVSNELRSWARSQGFETMSIQFERVGPELGGTTANPGRQFERTFDLTKRAPGEDG
jgi:hypothetical protein